MTPCHGKKSAMTAFLDGDPAGCVCTVECEFPCWQRVGLTDRPCCAGCVALPAVADDDVDAMRGKDQAA